MDLQEAIYRNPEARSVLGRLLVYLADQASKNDALASTITATQDLLQVVGDDVNMVPIYHALSTALAPDGATKRSLDLIERVRSIEGDKQWLEDHGGRRVIPRIMANAVTPMGPGRQAPIEVLMDCISDLHRADPNANGDAFAPDDYGSVAHNIQDFLVDPTRGLEQFYAIVKKRND
jgi:hypothetical protein